MDSNVHSARTRGQRRRVSSSQRLRPYGMTDFNVYIDTNVHYNLDIDEGSAANRTEEPCRVLIKRNNQDFNHGLDENQRGDDMMASPTPNASITTGHLQIIAEDENIVLVASLANTDTDSIGTLSPTLLQLHPTHIQSNSPTENGEQSLNSDQICTVPEQEAAMTSLYEEAMYQETSETEVKKESIAQTQVKSYGHTLTTNLFLNPHSLVRELPMPSVNAHKLANNLIKLSRYLKSPAPSDLCCLNCCRIPVLPVTGQCGHTRCMRCIVVNGTCPCGVNAPKTLFVNTVIREIIEKMIKYIRSPRILDPGTPRKTCEKKFPLIRARRRYYRRGHSFPRGAPLSNSPTWCFSRPRVPLTVQARFKRARALLAAGEYLQAAPHLARVAASTEPCARMARLMLAQTISALSEGHKRKSVSRELFQSVRQQSTISWLAPSDLECVLCTNSYTNPVSTPCGHTYCRTCIERSLYYKKKCALCLGPLENFKLPETQDTLFISSILSSIGVSQSVRDEDVIPVVTCYVAFPGMPCPLFMFNPRYWQMVRRVLESGTRRFGMLAHEGGNNFADYGTVLEICDCVVLEDNRCIVSTVGVSRFRVIERHIRDGCDVARIQPLTDVTPTEDELQDLHTLSSQISSKTQTWLKNMDEGVRKEIETAFGAMPCKDIPENWWNTSDGPNWLWWLIAILPLKSEIKILILSTRSLLKRMLAVSRTLDVMDAEFISNDSKLNITSREEWLRR
ncbi:unnamed protein product [Danaus chrysippus]|uniref:(African queen) hypothetical protein n=1 Tax=Danaus chrysippus TaxID=151541 RepID=A0A8J2MI23_9NEOP|nr:unnamed protein product [Danaus chrysippus]